MVVRRLLADDPDIGWVLVLAIVEVNVNLFGVLAPVVCGTLGFGFCKPLTRADVLLHFRSGVDVPRVNAL